ncbi:acyltransferase family protein [Curtobacterium sp. 22159]|uniref:acyltransferase family protein n=1 Tax=Curtobacterium sp. 22159 TaxID=3453882 RepID=UPI003F858788
MQQIEGRFRPEIQALRAIAVVAVVLYHLWPNRLPGGYVGVDVFFVISGFLIIGHLLRETEKTRSVDVFAFWARRVRRLLPASTLVLVATAIATLIWVPQVQWVQYFREFAASAVSLQNWLLSAASVDYLGADNAASPVQHFWSLSVEEQFYIVWPLIVLGVLALPRRRRRISTARRVFFVLTGITAVSLALSIVITITSPSTAYFDTTTRAWEIGLGGILAFLTYGRHKPRRVLAASMSWAGLAMIAAALLFFTAATPFPGWTALLPVVGTMLVIAAGMPHIWWSPTHIARLPRVQRLGAVSYSLYLWHWPILTIVPFAMGHPLGFKSKLAVIVLSLVLAVLTKRFVEDPARTMPALTRRRPLVSVVAGVATAVLVLGMSTSVATVTDATNDARADAMRHSLREKRPCTGALVVGNPDCTNPNKPTALTDPSVARSDIGKGVAVVDPCKQGLTQTEVMTCRVGDTEHPVKRIALVGDSHAGQYVVPLDRYGKAHRIEFVTYLKSYCAGLGIPGIAAAKNGQPATVNSCATWGASVQHDILASPDVQSVVFTNFTPSYTAAPAPWRSLTAGDFESVWKPLRDGGKQVVALRDDPISAEPNVPQCVAEHMDESDPCTTPLTRAQLAADRDPMVQAAAATDVPVVDMADVFCTDGTCHSVIGGLVVYFDRHHMTAAFAETTADIVGPRLDKATDPGHER